MAVEAAPPPDPAASFRNLCTGARYEEGIAAALSAFVRSEDMRPTALVEAEPPPPFESGYTQGRFLRQDSNRYAQQRSRDPHEAYARGVGSLRIDHVDALILERYPEQWNLVVHGHDSSVPAIIRLKGPVPDGVEAWLAGLLGDDIVIQGGERFSRTELSLRVRIFHCGLVKQGFVAQTGLNNEGIHAQVQSTEPLGDEVLEAVRAYSLTDLGDIPRGGELIIEAVAHEVGPIELAAVETRPPS